MEYPLAGFRPSWPTAGMAHYNFKKITVVPSAKVGAGGLRSRLPPRPRLAPPRPRPLGLRAPRGRRYPRAAGSRLGLGSPQTTRVPPREEEGSQGKLRASSTVGTGPLGVQRSWWTEEGETPGRTSSLSRRRRCCGPLTAGPSAGAFAHSSRSPYVP